MKTTHGARVLAVLKRSLTLRAPWPTRTSSNSDPAAWKKGTPASPATALARRVFPVPLSSKRKQTCTKWKSQTRTGFYASRESQKTQSYLEVLLRALPWAGVHLMPSICLGRSRSRRFPSTQTSLLHSPSRLRRLRRYPETNPELFLSGLTFAFHPIVNVKG